jgi:ribosomal protein S18 acetylase RimI-like enzyme
VAVERHFLSLCLDQSKNEQWKAGELQDFHISKWEKRFLNPAADVIYNSYLGSPDRLLCYDYQSPEGCTRFLHNLIHHPSCGVFTPETSWIALDSDGKLCAILLTSKIGPKTGMIPQISVRYDCQGMGIGSRLLTRYFQEAHQLYLRLGFQEQKDFNAFVRDPDQEGIVSRIN